MSPTKRTVDRRILRSELVEMLNDGKITMITGQKASEAVNKQFAIFSDEWEYNGIKYKVLTSEDYRKMKIKFIDQYPNHHFVGIDYNCPFFNDYGFRINQFDFKLDYYQGHIVWFKTLRYDEVVISLFKFKDINIMPTDNDFIKVDRLKNIKPIIIEHTNKIL